ncbi:MAG: endonuclease V [Thermoplasmata archaeon]
MYFYKKIQELISKNIVISNLKLEAISKVAAVDVSYTHNYAIGIALFIDKSKKISRYNVALSSNPLPYIPGYLFAREAPAMLRALRPFKPDFILVDGQGIAHPRRAGIATVIGVLLDTPAIGIAKSKLIGNIRAEKGISYLYDGDEIIGVENGKYIYSIGNKVDLENIIELSKKGYPAILKKTDKLSKEIKGKIKKCIEMKGNYLFTSN